MNLLAIDTSTERASVAVFANNIMYTKDHANIKQHAKYLLPMLDALLNEAGITLDDLDGIVYGSGPGSFTGLRVTCSVVKAIAYAKDLPLYPVSSLKAIAYAASSGEISADEGVLALIDARMNEVYWEFFTSFTSDDLHVTKAELIEIPDVQSIILAGVGLETYATLLPDKIRSLIKEPQNIYPLAELMIRLVLNNYIKPVSALEALPVYVRNQVVRG